jgi:hypothetical protein
VRLRFVYCDTRDRLSTDAGFTGIEPGVCYEPAAFWMACPRGTGCEDHPAYRVTGLWPGERPMSRCRKAVLLLVRVSGCQETGGCNWQRLEARTTQVASVRSRQDGGHLSGQLKGAFDVRRERTATGAKKARASIDWALAQWREPQSSANT